MSKKEDNFVEKAILGLFWLLIVAVLLILLSCEVSNIYIKGDYNSVEEEQSENVDVKVDSLKINTKPIF